jgi:DNA-binding MarR family transcriptional regulator
MFDVGKLILALQQFRKGDPHLGVVQAIALLEIAQKPGLNQVELAKRWGLSRSASQRIFSKLEKQLGWIEFRPTKDGRETAAYLTHRGKELVELVSALVS